MKRHLSGILSGVIVLSLILPTAFISGCSKKTETTSSDLPTEITSDMPWYESKLTYVTNDLDKYEHEYLFNFVLGIASDTIVTRTQGKQITDPNDFTGNSFSEYLQFYDMNGDHLYDIDVIQMIKDNNPDADKAQVIEVSLKDELVVLKTQHTENNAIFSEIIYIDPKTGEIADTEDFDPALEEGNLIYSCTVENKKIKIINIPNREGGMPECAVNVAEGDNEFETINLNEQLPFITIADVSDFVYLGDGKLLLKITNTAYSEFVCLVDLNNMTATDIRGDSNYDWVNSVDILDYSYHEGTGNVAVCSDGIKILDPDSKTEEMLISFDYCDINRFDVDEISLLSISDDKVILAGTSFRDEKAVELIASIPTTFVAVLTRSDSNPNTGKQVISAAFIGEMSYPICEAIRQFNNQDHDGFIMLDKRYDYSTIEQNMVFEEDTDEDTHDLQVRSAMMNQLSLDLLAGEGPDIIFGAINYRQIDQSDVLLDLSENVTSPSLYGNVMDFARTDGCLYQVPLAFGLEGIMVDSADVPSDAVGFTFESYNDYISGPCNGKDPNRMTRLTFMCTCIAEMSSTYQSGSGYNYNCDTFARTAEFVNNQILPDELDPEMLLQNGAEENPYTSDFVTIRSTMGLIDMTSGCIDSQRIMGFPSEDGLGLLINVSDSVAVSAATALEADCRAFVELLMSDDIQNLFAENCGLSVNRNSQEEVCEPFAEGYTRWYDSLSELYTQSQLDLYGLPLSGVDSDLLKEQINSYIENAAGIRMLDAPVEIIVREEIQAYFAGQKTIDETMQIIQNRVDTFVNERG